jgi:L-cysteine:1D-myo-inositol 2-amino-2-deoxy-alpha-D-glucopyranoside ligase
MAGAMRLYNTATGQVEEFTPRGPDVPVTIYACGITPYDVSHLGHALVCLTYDVLGRYLRYRGFQTRYVQNVTDIDDDILKRAARDGVPWDELGRTQTERYLATMDRLNMLRPDVYAKATEETDKMIEIISGLLEDGLAYNKGGNIFFRVKNDPNYGKLSKLDRDEMLRLAAERGGKPHDPLKDDPLDFLLWQAAAPGEPTWPSPWGPGRPGWHIECSAMAMRYLGDTIDIHGGGSDLIFPHHESEIAQSEGYTGKEPFVRYWMHVGMLRYQGEKMSKSLGNLVMAPVLLETYSPDAIRLALLSHRYRESWEYEEVGDRGGAGPRRPPQGRGRGQGRRQRSDDRCRRRPRQLHRRDGRRFRYAARPRRLARSGRRDRRRPRQRRGHPAGAGDPARTRRCAGADAVLTQAATR